MSDVMVPSWGTRGAGAQVGRYHGEWTRIPSLMAMRMCHSCTYLFLGEVVVVVVVVVGGGGEGRTVGGKEGRGGEAYMQYGVCDLPVRDDSGAALLCRPPGSVHFGHHAPPAPHALVPKLDAAVQLRAIGMNDPARDSISSNQR